MISVLQKVHAAADIDQVVEKMLAITNPWLNHSSAYEFAEVVAFEGAILIANVRFHWISQACLNRGLKEC